MGSKCAWCDTVLRGHSFASQAVSHALCHGCLEDLRLALGTKGLVPKAGAPRASATQG